MTPFVWKNALRTEIVTTGHGFVISYDLQGKELWRVGGMSMPTASPISRHGLLYVGTGSQGDANRPFFAIKPGASGDITLKPGETSNEFIAWSPSARVRLYAVGARARRAAPTSFTTPASSSSRRQDGQGDLQGARRRRRPHVLRVADRRRQPHLLPERRWDDVRPRRGRRYNEIARNDLGEMSLASPAIAGDAIYIRTEKKLYKIGARLP